MVTLDQVTKEYSSVRALDDVSLHIPAGTTAVLIGPSGCGKSSLLRTINGLIRPDRGQVLVDGSSVDPDSVRAIRHKIGYAIQGGGLFPHLTASGNVTLLAKHLGMNADAMSLRVRELCQLSHFPVDRLEAYPGQLSGGQNQRVALMRALMLDPPILLLDEPLGALDPLIRAELQDDLREIIRTLKKTVVFVTHDLPEAAHFADTIVLMRAGRIEQRGTYTELVQEPASEFVTSFITAQQSLSLPH